MSQPLPNQTRFRFDQSVTGQGDGRPCLVCGLPTQIVKAAAKRPATERCSKCNYERAIDRRPAAQTGGVT
jgi:hypothetical protein